MTGERLTRTLLWGGALGPLLVSAFLIAGAAVTPGYSHLSDTVSQLAARGAPHPEVIQIGLVLWGALLEGLGWGLFRRLGPGPGPRAVQTLLTVSGAAIQLAAFVRDDPNVASAPSTLEGGVHGLLASLAFLGLFAAMVVFARTVRTDAAAPDLEVLPCRGRRDLRHRFCLRAAALSAGRRAPPASLLRVVRPVDGSDRRQVSPVNAGSSPTGAGVDGAAGWFLVGFARCRIARARASRSAVASI